jgi:hypothetical protein
LLPLSPSGQSTPHTHTTSQCASDWPHRRPRMGRAACAQSALVSARARPAAGASRGAGLARLVDPHARGGRTLARFSAPARLRPSPNAPKTGARQWVAIELLPTGFT